MQPIQFKPPILLRYQHFLFGWMLQILQFIKVKFKISAQLIQIVVVLINQIQYVIKLGI
jgi:hypothetical protein